jgi:hypothetical protein
VPETPLLYRYVKEYHQIPASWWDHLKFDLRIWAIVNLGRTSRKVIWWIFSDVKTREIPITYEFYGKPKPKGGR